jgi:hypothetical protein
MNGPLEYEAKMPLRWRPPPWAGRAAVAAGIVGVPLLISVLLPSFNRIHHEPSWTQCAGHLRAIGHAIRLYANENHGQMPPDFASLRATQDLTGEHFICFGTNDQRTAATQAADIRADFAGGGFCSYAYVDGLGRLSAVAADDVVAFEPPGHHDRSAVLFGDGHTEGVDDVAATEIARQFAAGVRPIRLPAP